jgi:hypothetical protein
MLPRDGSATGLNAGSQPSGTRLGGATASVDGELCDDRSAGAGDSRSPLLARLTENKLSLVGAEILAPLAPIAAGALITTAATTAAAPMIKEMPAIRDIIEPIELLVISLFISHPRYR